MALEVYSSEKQPFYPVLITLLEGETIKGLIDQEAAEGLCEHDPRDEGAFRINVYTEGVMFNRSIDDWERSAHKTMVACFNGATIRCVRVQEPMWLYKKKDWVVLQSEPVDS